MRGMKRTAIRTAAAASVIAAAGASGSAGLSVLGPHPAHAAFPATLPTRCFTTEGTFHQIFGPSSFFLAETQQAPTGLRENGPDPSTATYPLYRGTSPRGPVYYVITDASDTSVAQDLGSNYTPKLANAIGSAAVQNSASTDPRHIDFPAGVDFSPTRVLTPGPNGFPPVAAQPGAVGDTGYSPLVQLGNTGVVVDAEQIANSTGQADKIVSMDTTHMTVTYQETEGCYENQSVHYASFDASIALAAAIEDVTYAPALGSAPSAGCAEGDVTATPPGSEGMGCSREGLIAFINGQTGLSNANRQGLNAAILDGVSPLNILEDVPNNGGQFNYSPLWDIHLLAWTQNAIDRGLVSRQTDFAAARDLVAEGLATGTGPGGSYEASGFIVNCPLISIDANVPPPATGNGALPIFWAPRPH